MEDSEDYHDLFRDDPLYENQKRSLVVNSNTKSNKTKVVQKLESSNTDKDLLLGCVLCFGGNMNVLRCQKCLVKVCENCRHDNGSSNSYSFNCSDCLQGGIGLEVLTTAPKPKRQKSKKDDTDEPVAKVRRKGKRYFKRNYSRKRG